MTKMTVKEAQSLGLIPPAAFKPVTKPRKTATDYANQFTQPLPVLNTCDPWKIRLPMAPTVNHYRTIGHGRLVTSAAGREYHAAVRWLWSNHWHNDQPAPLTCRLRLRVWMTFGTNPPPDIDNRIKPLQDALAYAGVFANDNQIDEIIATRSMLVCKPGWMDVTIEPI